MIPRREHDVAGQRQDRLEKALPCHDLPPGGFPHRGGEIEHRVTRESQQVQLREHAGEVSAPVPEIVFEVVSFGLQRVDASFSTCQRARPTVAIAAILSADPAGR